jgi:hypothetical protein
MHYHTHVPVHQVKEHYTRAIAAAQQVQPVVLSPESRIQSPESRDTLFITPTTCYLLTTNYQLPMYPLPLVPTVPSTLYLLPIFHNYLIFLLPTT